MSAFYFEATIEHGGSSNGGGGGGGGGCGVSIGLYRDGLPLEGVPGHNSVAYGGCGRGAARRMGLARERA